jgi:hypothetical protein
LYQSFDASADIARRTDFGLTSLICQIKNLPGVAAKSPYTLEQAETCRRRSCIDHLPDFD